MIGKSAPHSRYPTAGDGSEHSLSAKEMWRRSEQYFQALIENSLDGICVLDGNGMILYESRSVQHIVGYGPEERRGKSVFDLVHPDDLPSIAGAFKHLLQSQGAATHVELRLVHKDGSHRFVEATGQNLLDDPMVQSIVVNFRDITDRRDAETRYRTLTENLADVIWTLDLNMRPTYISSSITRLLGYSVEEAMAKAMEEVFTPASFETAMSVFNKEMAVEETQQQDPNRSRTLEIEMMRKDGSTAPVEIKAAFLRDPDGRPVEVLVIARDISERRQAEAEKHEAQLQLQIAGRLAAVGELAAGIAHELSNPLAAVQTFARALADTDNANHTTKRYAEAILREAERATKRLSNVVLFSRRQKPDKRLVSINEALERSLELCASRMRVHNIQVVKQMDPSLPQTMADLHQLQLAFLNIIAYAERAMVKGSRCGKLSVETHQVGTLIQVVFTDNGPGMTEDDLESLFDPMYSAEAVEEGSNLGLAISLSIVRDHGGLIHAMTNPSEGMTFVVELPVESDERSTSE